MQSRVGIFGGSFDPPHNGHLEIMRASILQLKLNELFVVPSFLNPFKKSFCFTPLMRLKWMESLKEILMEDIKTQIHIVDYEVLQNAPTPTFKTLEFIKVHFLKGDEAQIFLLVGADNVESLPKWEQFERLKGAVEFVIIPRENYAIPSFYQCLEFSSKCSSTKVRETLKVGDYKQLEHYLPKRILESVKEQFCADRL